MLKAETEENSAQPSARLNGGISIGMKEKAQISGSTPVLSAAEGFMIMSVQTENTAPGTASESGVPSMDAEYFEKLKNYLSAMALAKKMLSDKLINTAEYRVIETKMCKKYGINSRSLYRVNEWIYPRNRGNMGAVKEVV